MSTVIVLATIDADLRTAWRKQIPENASVLEPEEAPFGDKWAADIPHILIIDSAFEKLTQLLPQSAPTTIFVGEPGSLPFEQAKLSNRARLYFSYQESTVKLKEAIPLLIEISETASLLRVLASGGARSNVPPPASSIAGDGSEIWEYLENVIENLGSRDRLLAEFRRAFRHLLRASHTVFFFRESEGFRADQGTSFLHRDDPLVSYLEMHPVVVDGCKWDSPPDPRAELSLRARLSHWGARLLVPVHERGRLLGLIAMGVRDDGQPYDDASRKRIVYFARLLRLLLAQSSKMERLLSYFNTASIASKYLPATLILGPEEGIPRHVPLVVKDIIAQVRKGRETLRVLPSIGQPFRATCGIIDETGGTWSCWEEASSDVEDSNAREVATRKALFRELGLTLNHEIGNSLVSLATFRQAELSRPLPQLLLQTVKDDILKIELLNKTLLRMQGIADLTPSIIDIRDIARSIGDKLNIRIEVGHDPVLMNVAYHELEFALSSLVQTLAENRGAEAYNDLALKVRSTGVSVGVVALFSIKGKNLELEGILPVPQPDAVPNQGRLGIFLAKAIFHLHGGGIHAGPGIEGTEILVSIRGL